MIPASAFYGCDIDHLLAPLPVNARASDMAADSVAVIEALKACRDAHASLVTHVKIDCPD